MSEINETNTVTDAESAAEGLSTPTEGVGTGEQQNPGNREARYRVERNQARDERDELAKRVQSLLTREAERVASKHLSEPADLFALTGKTIKDFLGEDGEVDVEAVTQAANDLLGSRPGLAKNAPAVDHSQGLGGGGRPSQPSWEMLLH